MALLLFEDDLSPNLSSGMSIVTDSPPSTATLQLGDTKSTGGKTEGSLSCTDIQCNMREIYSGADIEFPFGSLEVKDTNKKNHQCQSERMDISMSTERNTYRPRERRASGHFKARLVTTRIRDEHVRQHGHIKEEIAAVQRIPIVQVHP
jgi:hypothetical protein